MKRREKEEATRCKEEKARVAHLEAQIESL